MGRQFLEAFVEHGRRYAADGTLEIAEARSAVQQFAQDQNGPFFAENFGGFRNRAILSVFHAGSVSAVHR